MRESHFGIRERDTSNRANIGLTANIDRAVCDHDVRKRDFIAALQFGYDCQSQDRSCRSVSSDFTVIARLFPELGQVSLAGVWDAAIVDFELG